MRLVSRAVAGILAFFGVVGLLFGLEISDIERGQTQAICGAVLLVGGILTWLLGEIIARLDRLAAARPEAEAAYGQEYGIPTPAPGLTMHDAVPTPDTYPVVDETPAPMAPAPTPTGATAPAEDPAHAAMAAVAAAIGEPADEPAPPEAAPSREAPRPGLAAILAANRGLEPARRPSLFERVRAERAAAQRNEPAAPADPVAPRPNPFAPRDPFGRTEPFGAPAAEPEEAPAAPVLNLRPTLTPDQPAPVERARPSLRALAASRDREEAASEPAALPPGAPSLEPTPAPPPERPPFPRDIFARTMPRAEEPGSADMRLRERLAALRGEPAPAEAETPREAAPPAVVPDQAITPGPDQEVVGRYESNGATYVMYADGTIEAETETGVFRFGSLDELKAYIEGGGK